MQEEGWNERRAVGKLFADENLLGYVRETHFDQPLTYYDFEPVPGFRQYEELFRRERELAKSPRHDDAFRREYGEVVERMEALGLRIVEWDGSEVHLRQIIIDGPKARWRAGFQRAFSTERPGGVP